MIGITSDIDWASEEVIADMLQVFIEYKIKCTFFCTHKSEVLLNANHDLFELSVHPNFNPLLEGRSGTAEAIIDELLAIYPAAKGVRSHSLLQSSALLNLFAQKGFDYESNQLLPYQVGIQPSHVWNGLTRLPIVWEDDIHWMYQKEFDQIGIDLSDPGLKIFNFHPVHVYLNTVNNNHYQEAKQFYHDSRELKKHSNYGPKKGVRDALLHLITEIKRLGLPTYTLSEIKKMVTS